MSLNSGQKLKKFLTAFLICGAFLFVVSPNNALAASTNYDKQPNGTLTAAEWNNLKNDFVNTWEEMRMNGPLGINTTTPTTPIFLAVGGNLQANTGLFSGVGIGTTTPLDLLSIGPQYTTGISGAGHNSTMTYAVSTDTYALANIGYVQSALSTATSSLADAIGLWGGNKNSNIWNGTSGAGNVGIGTTNPSALLHVNGSSIFNGVADFRGSVAIDTNPDNNSSGFEYGNGYDPLVANYNNERFRINSFFESPFMSMGVSINYLLQTEVFDSASWVKTNIGAVTANTVMNPTGILSAENIPAGTIGTANISQVVTNNTTGYWSAGIWARAQSGTSTISLRIDSSAETGTVKVVNLDTTWRFFSIAQNFSLANTTKTFRIISGTNAVSLWGARMNPGESVNAYNARTTSALTAATPGIFFNNNVVYAGTFSGSLSGNANSATYSSYGAYGGFSPSDAVNKTNLWAYIGEIYLAYNSTYRFGQSWNTEINIKEVTNQLNKTNDQLENAHILMKGTMPTVADATAFNTTVPSFSVALDGNDMELTPSDVVMQVYSTNATNKYIRLYVRLKHSNTHYTILPINRYCASYSSTGALSTSYCYFNVVAMVAAALPAPVQGSAVYATQGALSNLWKLSGNDIFNQNSGNVGIGTTTPLDLLDIGPQYTTGITGSGHNSTMTYAVSTDTYALANIGYVQSALSTATSSLADSIGLWGGNKNGTIWNGDAGLGNVGIGTTNPSYPLDVNGTTRINNGEIKQQGTVTSPTSGASLLNVSGTLVGSSNNQQEIISAQAYLSPNTGGTLGSVYGLLFLPGFRNSSDNITNVNGLFLRTDLYNTYSGTVGTYNALTIAEPYYEAGGTGSITNVRGILSAISSGTNKYNLYISGSANNYFAGNVGIGTTTPSVGLHVNSDTGLRISRASNPDQLMTLVGGNGSGLASITSAYNLKFIGGTSPSYGYFQFSNSSGDLMRITQTGNVGIGTTTPLDLLDIGPQYTTGIAGSGHNSTMTYAVSTDTYALANIGYVQSALSTATSSLANTIGLWGGNKNGNIWNGDAGVGNVGIGTTNPLGTFHVSNASSSNALVVAATGRVGIGTTNPTSQLMIVPIGTNYPTTNYIKTTGDLNGQILNIGSNTSSSYTGLGFDVNGTNNWFLGRNGTYNTANFLYLKNSNNAIPVLTFADTTGNVGIGTTTPNSKLNVYGTSGDVFTVSGPSGNTLVMNNSGNATLSINDSRYAGNGKISLISEPGGNKSSVLSSGRLILGSDNSEAMRIVSGNVGIGTTTPLDLLDIGPQYTTGIAGSGHNSTMTYAVSTDTYALANIGYVQSYFSSVNHNPVTPAAIGSASNANGLTIAAGQVLNLEPASASFGGVVTTGTQTLAGAKTFTGTATFNNATYSALFTGGNVGIGTTNPIFKLDVAGDIKSNSLIINRSTVLASSKISLNGDGTNPLISAQFGSTSNIVDIFRGYNSSGAIVMGIAGDTSNGSLVFKTSGGDEEMRIDATGNVGIGTTSPSTSLDVVSANANPLRIYRNSGNSSLQVQNDITSAYFGLNGSDNIALGFALDQTNAPFQINSSGNVGIGTTTPLDLLDIGPQYTTGIAGSGHNSTMTYAVSSDTYALANIGYVQSALSTATSSLANTIGLWGGNKNGNIWNGDAGVGNVGIGTTSPTHQLEIYNNTGASYPLYIQGASGNRTGFVFDKSDASNYLGMLVNTGSNGVVFRSNVDILFNNDTYANKDAATGGTNLLTIKSTGNVGIGTSAPDKKLTVNQSNDTDGIRLYGSTIPSSYFDMFINSLGNPRFATNNSMVFDAAGGMYFRSGATGTYFNDLTSRNTSFNNGQLYLTAVGGNVGIGTTTPLDLLDIGPQYTTGISGSGHNSTMTYAVSSDTYALANIGYVQSALSTATSSLANTIGLWGGNKNGNIWNGDAGLGNVGIGTTTPAYKMEVSGTFKVSTSSSSIILDASGNILIGI